MYYVNVRWPGGMMTNFKTIKKSINRLNTLTKMAEDGTFDMLPKKEAAARQKEMADLERNYGGIKNMNDLPAAIFVVDTKKEAKAVKEAKKLGVKVSFDFNYRAKLMTVEEAKKVYPLVAGYADIVSASPWDIRTLLSFEPEEMDSDKLFMDACNHFGFDYLFTKKRTILSARSQTLKPFCYTKDRKFEGQERKFEIFDRIGAGDAFTAGYLHGLLLDYGCPEDAMDYGMANCILEQTIFGDCSVFTHEDLVDYLKTAGLEEVKR